MAKRGVLAAVLLFLVSIPFAIGFTDSDGTYDITLSIGYGSGTETLGEYNASWEISGEPANTISAGGYNLTLGYPYIIEDAGALVQPTVQLTAPADSQTLLNSTVEFKFYSSSAYNSTLGYNLTINGAVNKTGTAVNGTTTSASVQLANGSYTWNVKVWDYANNAKTSATNTFNVLVELPVQTLTILPIAAGETNNSGIISLAGQGVPDEVIEETGITGYEYFITANGTTPEVELNISIFLEHSPAGVSDISGLAGAISGFYFAISVNDSSWYNNVSSIQLRIYYNLLNLSIPSGYAESSLRLARYTSGSWVKLDCDALSCTATLSDGTILYVSGVDTANDYVWANLSRFSTYGIAGITAPSAPVSSGGGGGRGCYDECTLGERVCMDGSIYICGNFDSDICTEWTIETCQKGQTCQDGKCVPLPCIEDWVCDEWTKCSDGFQTRRCADWNSCDTSYNRPATQKECAAPTALVLEIKDIISPGAGLLPSIEQPAETKATFSGFMIAFVILLAAIIILSMIKFKAIASGSHEDKNMQAYQNLEAGGALAALEEYKKSAAEEYRRMAEAAKSAAQHKAPKSSESAQLKTIITEAGSIKASIKQAEETIRKINKFKNAEQNELEIWRTHIRNVKKKLDYVDMAVLSKGINNYSQAANQPKKRHSRKSKPAKKKR